MTPRPSTPAESLSPARHSPLPPLDQIVSQTIAAWRAARDQQLPHQPSTLELTRQYPELTQRDSLLLDLAVEEFCLLRDRGELVDPAEFAKQFPTVGETLYRLVGYFEANSDQVRQLLFEEASSWPEVSTVFGGYLILQELHRGPTKRVFLAAELAIGHRLVILKVSSLPTREAALLGKLPHPRIVPILSVHTSPLQSSGKVTSPRFHTIVMPFLGCTTLLDIVQSTWRIGARPTTSNQVLTIARDGSLGECVPVPQSHDESPALDIPYEEYVVRIVRELAEALQYAHDRNVIHRDLKPSNVLLTPSGIPMLMDFDVSTDPSTESSQIAGTLPYMAPEILERVCARAILIEFGNQDTDPNLQDLAAGISQELSAHERTSQQACFDLDRRGDIFSLGVIFYELLTGKLPFPVESAEVPIACQANDLLTRHTRFPLVRTDENRHIPEQLFHLIDRCLAPLPALRPSSAKEFASCLDGYLSDQQRRRVWKSQSTKVWAVIAIAVAFLGILAFGTFMLTVDDRRAAIEAYESGDFSRATSHFAKAIQRVEGRRSSIDKSKESDLNRGELANLYFGRAQAYRQLEKFTSASTDYSKALEEITDARIIFCLAYTNSQLGNDRDAMALYDVSIRELERASGRMSEDERRILAGACRNNIAFHQLRSGALGFARDNIQVAEALLEERTELSSIVLSNKIELFAKLAKEGFITRVALLECLHDTRTLAEVDDADARLQFVIAKGYAIVAEDGDSSVMDEAVRAVVRAASSGCSRELLDVDEDISLFLRRGLVPKSAFLGGASAAGSFQSAVICPLNDWKLGGAQEKLANR